MSAVATPAAGRSWTAAEIADVRRLWLAGGVPAEIAAAVGRSESAIAARLSREGVLRDNDGPRGGVPAAAREAVCHRARQGWQPSRIARQVGLDVSAVQSILDRRGVAVSRRRPVYAPPIADVSKQVTAEVAEPSAGPPTILLPVASEARSIPEISGVTEHVRWAVRRRAGEGWRTSRIARQTGLDRALVASIISREGALVEVSA